jgi:hypothetical protein
MAVRDMGGGQIKMTYDWKKKFLFRSKVSVYGKLLKRWQFVNRRIVLLAEGADALEYRDYATDKELFQHKLRGTE